MKKIIATVLSLLLLSTPAHAIIKWQGKWDDTKHKWDDKSNIIQQLVNVGGLTFYEDYEVPPGSSINADYSIGSRVGTFTATRSSTTPATYTDENGKIILVTESNLPRFNSAIYDSTGLLTDKKGLIIEGAGTNLSTYTDGTASGSGLWTGWTLTNDTGTTATQSQVSASAISSIANSYSQRLELSGQTATDKSFRIAGPLTTVGSASNGNVITLSCLVRTQTATKTGTVLRFSQYDQNSTLIQSTNSTSFDITTSWTRQSASFTAADSVKTSCSATRLTNLVTVVKNGHSFLNGSYITLSGFATINGSGTMALVDENTFTLTIAGDDVAVAETGTATRPVSQTRFNIGYVTNVDTGDVIDFEIYAPQVEVNPYATSWIPTTTAALTRNAEVLKYICSGNRSDTETIFVKFIPLWSTNNAVVGNYMLDNEGDRRLIFSSNATKYAGYPNYTDNAAVNKSATTNVTQNSSIINTFVFKHTAPYVIVYSNGSQDAFYSTADWTANDYGSLWYLGNKTPTSNASSDSIIQKVAFFNRALNSTEVAQVTTLLQQ